MPPFCQYYLTVLHPIAPPQQYLISKRMSPPPYATRSYVGLQVSQRLAASSVTEAKPSSPPLYVCQETHISYCILPHWWLSVREISKVQVS